MVSSTSLLLNCLKINQLNMCSLCVDKSIPSKREPNQEFSGPCLKKNTVMMDGSNNPGLGFRTHRFIIRKILILARLIMPLLMWNVKGYTRALQA